MPYIKFDKNGYIFRKIDDVINNNDYIIMVLRKEDNNTSFSVGSEIVSSHSHCSGTILRQIPHTLKSFQNIKPSEKFLSQVMDRFKYTSIQDKIYSVNDMIFKIQKGQTHPLIDTLHHKLFNNINFYKVEIGNNKEFIPFEKLTNSNGVTCIFLCNITIPRIKNLISADYVFKTHAEVEGLELPILKNKKKQEVTTNRKEHTYDPFVYNNTMYKGSQKSQQHLNQAIQLINLKIGNSLFMWDDIYGNIITLTDVDMRVIFKMLSDRKNALFMRERELHHLIDITTTMSELQNLILTF